ncbi:uncharacterized protein STEHIDRAFT_121520, partial [Stereum hirsutum FP-91666 SS1]|uniref:uncharacterized protein n=1 Tax=Stereum hirsutum (strain FP-91666) TaxID=721885 RepID=UPI000440A30B
PRPCPGPDPGEPEPLNPTTANFRGDPGEGVIEWECGEGEELPPSLDSLLSDVDGGYLIGIGLVVFVFPLTLAFCPPLPPCIGNNASKKSSGHLPLPRLILSILSLSNTSAFALAVVVVAAVVLTLANFSLSRRPSLLAAAKSSASSATLDRSTTAPSLGLLSLLDVGTGMLGMLGMLAIGEGLDVELDVEFFLPSCRSSASILPSVLDSEGHSDGTNDVASVVTVLIVPYLPPFPFPLSLSLSLPYA